jgi:hypothetical protein
MKLNHKSWTVTNMLILSFHLLFFFDTYKNLNMSPNTITLPAAADFHLHLRQDEMMRMVTPMVSKGGVSLAYIMVSQVHGICRRYFETFNLTHQ